MGRHINIPQCQFPIYLNLNLKIENREISYIYFQFETVGKVHTFLYTDIGGLLIQAYGSINSGIYIALL